MSKIKIVFGEMGAGKNYWGERMANLLDYKFLDGDTVAPPEMIERVSKFKPLTREMVKSYIHIELYGTIITELQNNPKGLVVAQALYLEEDRLWLRDRLESFGHEVNFHWVKSPFWRNLKQIYSRVNGIRWVLYWLLNKPFFQKPTHTYNQL